MFIPCLFLAGFLTFVSLRMATMETEINLHFTYSAPVSDFDGIEYEAGYGQWAVTLDGKTIAKSAEDLPIQPTASTAKMIMALAVMEKKPFNLGENGEAITITGDIYNIYARYVAIGGSTTKVALGEEISEYEALESALIASSNNMADALAIWAFDSLEEYSKYANEMVNRLGATNTYVGPDASGFDDTTTSTAADLALIGEAVLKQPVLAEIVGKTSAEVPVAGLIENTNKLLGTDGIIGVKTGYIGATSGYCLVSGYRQGEEIVTLAVMGAPYRQTSFDTTLDLVKKAQEKITTSDLVSAGEEIGYYKTWWSKKATISADNSVSGVVISEAKANYDEGEKVLTIETAETKYSTGVSVEEFRKAPTFWQRFLHVFGWEAE